MKSQLEDILSYYAQPGVMTDPGEYSYLLDGLPSEVDSLVQIVQNNLIHIFWAERYGLNLPEERQQEVQIRPVRAKLARLLSLADQPLNASRPLEKRLVGNCRDFSVVLTAFLRHKGIPARARCGFGTYFLPGHYEDHWVVEYWKASEERWVMVDAQLDGLQQQALGIQFDPLDMPPGQFWIAGQAWQTCRAGKANPDDFGIFDMHGMDFIHGNVVRDILALNKIEILPWDGGWGLLFGPPEVYLPEEERVELMDRIAALTLAGDEAFPEIRELGENQPGLRVPQELWTGTA